MFFICFLYVFIGFVILRRPQNRPQGVFGGGHEWGATKKTTRRNPNTVAIIIDLPRKLISNMFRKNIAYGLPKSCAGAVCLMGEV